MMNNFADITKLKVNGLASVASKFGSNEICPGFPNLATDVLFIYELLSQQARVYWPTLKCHLRHGLPGTAVLIVRYLLESTDSFILIVH